MRLVRPSYAGIIAALVAACGGNTQSASEATDTDGGRSADGGVGDGATLDAGADGALRDGFVPLTCKDGATPLAALSASPAFDYVELRREDGYQTTVPDAVLDKVGTPCAHATDVAKCQDALANLQRPVPLSCSVPYPCGARYLAVTRGDEVRAYLPNDDDLVKAVAPLDSVDEAAFVLAWSRTMSCSTASYRASGDGYDIAYSYDEDMCSSADHLNHHHEVLQHVAKNGDIRLIEDVDTPTEPPSGVGCAAARRATGVRYETPQALEDAADWLAAAAHLEAASVASFARLARELAAHGAPRELVDRAGSAARDERRHARLLRALARAAGSAVARAPRIDARVRSLEMIALENAVEGATRETWGAVVVAYQARAAKAPALRHAFSEIARDEAAHAALAADVAAWLDARLSPATRGRVEAARRVALAAIAREDARAVPEPARAELGLPTCDVAARLFAGASEQLLRAW